MAHLGARPGGTVADGRPPARRKGCAFCQEGACWVDYTDAAVLRRFLGDRGTLRARRASGNCAQHQREVVVAIKTARELGLLPYAERTVAERHRGRTLGRPAAGDAGVVGTGRMEACEKRRGAEPATQPVPADEEG